MSVFETKRVPTTSQFDKKIFRSTIRRYHISSFFREKLNTLADFKIVFILDDSGSMNEYLDDSPLNHGSFKATRWDELKEFIRISIDITKSLSPDGCDVYFLNRPMIKNVINFEDIQENFRTNPGGFTPMAKIFNIVMKNSQQHNLEVNEKPKKVLVVIATDGEPTDLEGNVDIKGFKECLICRPNHVYTTILACTDEENSMEYLNNWDKYIQKLDVVDDFRTERKEVLRAKGINFNFSYGDYVAKCLVGSTDPTVDNLIDETNKNCCNIF